MPLIRIFLASPGDVKDEREMARQLIDAELPKKPALRGHVALEVIAWDDPAARIAMLATETPQASVNAGRPRPANCDIVVVVLWSRMGTPLAGILKKDGSPYLSGTEWEFDDAVSSPRKPPPLVLLYWRSEEPMFGGRDPKKREKEQQLKALDSFLDRFRNADGSQSGGINDYATPSEFKNLLSLHLEEKILRLLESWAGSTTSPVPQATESPSKWTERPYPGLRPFTLTEGQIFFGRGRDADALIARLRDPAQRFLAVFGDSGTGKSSLVYAGLLPRLKAGALEGSSAWRVVDCKPAFLGDDAFVAFADALIRASSARTRDRPVDLAERLFLAPGSIVETTQQLLPGGDPVVLFIDQMEELFTQTREACHQPFAEMLAAANADIRFRVLVTLRADYVPAVMRLQSLQGLFQQGSVPLGPLSTIALSDAIRGPAALAGIDLDESLAEAILHDAGSEPGALPLIAFCLRQLFDRKKGRRLDVEAYEEIGRLRGAVGRHAEDVVEHQRKTQGPAVDACLDTLFTAVAALDASGKPSRRRSPKDVLPRDAGFSSLVDALVQGRLLTITGRADQSRIELAHEALFEGWPKLKQWLDANRMQLTREAELAADVVRWKLHHDPSYLLPAGRRLDDARAFVEEKGPSADPTLREFVEQSTAMAAQQMEDIRRKVYSELRPNAPDLPARSTATPRFSMDEDFRLYGELWRRPQVVLMARSLPHSRLWLEKSLDVMKAVAAIRTKSQQIVGTGFLVRGADLSPRLGDELLVITAHHVVNDDDPEGRGSFRPQDIEVAFETGDPPVSHEVERVLWSAPVDKADASLLRLKQRPAATGLSLAATLPPIARGTSSSKLFSERPEVVIMGYPGTRSLALSQGTLLDHEAPPHGTPPDPAVRRVHYDARTEGGSSGSPVFNGAWQVIALHHLARPSGLPRLNGQLGTYGAAEGIWIQSIVESIRAGLGFS